MSLNTSLATRLLTLVLGVQSSKASRGFSCNYNHLGLSKVYYFQMTHQGPDYKLCACSSFFSSGMCSSKKEKNAYHAFN